jgi:hypothetical protein
MRVRDRVRGRVRGRFRVMVDSRWRQRHRKILRWRQTLIIRKKIGHEEDRVKQHEEKSTEKCSTCSMWDVSGNP